MQTLASPGMGALQSGQTFRLDGVSALNIFLPLPAAIMAKPIRASRIPKDNPKNGDCQNRIAARTISAMPIFVNMVVVSFNSSRLNRNSARYGPPQLDADQVLPPASGHRKTAASPGCSAKRDGHVMTDSSSAALREDAAWGGCTACRVLAVTVNRWTPRSASSNGWSAGVGHHGPHTVTGTRLAFCVPSPSAPAPQHLRLPPLPREQAS